MRTTFWRDFSPWRSVTARLGRPSFSARKRQSSSLARPSRAGAWTLILSASPSQPAIAVRGALGIALMASVQLLAAWLMRVVSVSLSVD